MPVYEYRCDGPCQGRTTYEKYVRGNVEDSELEFSCPVCGDKTKTRLFSSFATRNESIHASERPVILTNDKGEIKYLPQRDMAIDPKYLAQGFRKVEAFTTFAERDTFEAAHGKLHERSHYDPGSATAEHDLDPGDTAAKALAKFKPNHVTL